MGRNRILFSRKISTPKETVEQAMSFLLSFQTVVAKPMQMTQHPQDRTGKWKPPDEGWMMLNTDVSFCSDKAGYGYVLRDHHGKVCKSGASGACWTNGIMKKF